MKIVFLLPFDSIFYQEIKERTFIENVFEDENPEKVENF